MINTIEDLKIGEIYHYEFAKGELYIFEYSGVSKSNEKSISASAYIYNEAAFRINIDNFAHFESNKHNFKIASDEEKQWLNACKRKGNFVSRQLALSKLLYPVLPEKWCVEVTNDNEDIIRKWRTPKISDKSSLIGYIHNKRISGFNNNGYWSKVKLEGYTEISFEQFQKDVLGQTQTNDSQIEDLKFSANWKKGDIVECLCNSGDRSYTQGTLYTIKEIRENTICTELDNYRSTNNGWSKGNFKFHSRPLKTEWVPKVGDWVVFDVEKAKQNNFYTKGCWNKPYVLKIDNIEINVSSANTFVFLDQIRSRSSRCSNSSTCFRKAEDHEVISRTLDNILSSYNVEIDLNVIHDKKIDSIELKSKTNTKTLSETVNKVKPISIDLIEKPKVVLF